MPQATGTLSGEWHRCCKESITRVSTIVQLYHGTKRSPSWVQHTHVTGLRIRCTRLGVPGDIVGPPDLPLIREHQWGEEHQEGDIVAIPHTGVLGLVFLGGMPMGTKGA